MDLMENQELNSRRVRGLAPENDPLKIGMGWTLEDLEKMGYKLSTSTIYRYLHEMGIQRRDLDAEILELMQQDPTITIKDIATALGKSPSTIKRHIKRLAGKSKIRQRQKPWIVLDENTA